MDGCGYWQKLAAGRWSRRKVLVGGAAIGAGAVALACGGGGGGGGGSGSAGSSTNSVVTQPVDTTKDAVNTGTLHVTGSDQSTLDSLFAGAGQALTPYTGLVYSRLLRFKPGHLEPSKGDVDGDLAESWEVVGDGTQVNLKLRQNVPWDPRPPTNGRLFDARDVAFSWDKFSTKAVSRFDFANAANPNAPIVNITTPDSKTAVVKIAFPLANITQMLASGNMQIQPLEAADKFDPRGDMRGTGPFRLKEYKIAVQFEFERNPDWYMKGLPLLANYIIHVVPEYATRLAQFRAGNLDTGVVQSADIIQTKTDIPRLNMYEGSHASNYRGIFFGYAGDSPFKDVRVRRAVANFFDRQTMDAVVYNLDKFRAAGFPATSSGVSHGLTAAWGQYWVNPDDNSNDQMGDRAKWFKFDIAEGKKQLAAAGFPDGFDVDLHGLKGNELGGATYARYLEVTAGMLREGGIRPVNKAWDFNSEWLPQFFYSKGNFTGMFMTGVDAYPDPGDTLYTFQHDNASRPHHPPGVLPQSVLKMLEDQRTEFNAQKRLTLIRDVQRAIADYMPDVPWYGTTTGYSLAWPWVMNLNVYRGWPSGLAGSETTPYIWIDESKRKTG
jgi:peptide/nickel transport system substrate-binding protein